MKMDATWVNTLGKQYGRDVPLVCPDCRTKKQLLT